MSDLPIQVIVAAFDNPDEASAVMADLKAGKKEGLIGIIDAAVVVKDGNGKLKVTDSRFALIARSFSQAASVPG